MLVKDILIRQVHGTIEWSEICISFNVIKIGKTDPLDFKIWISYSCSSNLGLKYSQHSFNAVLQILLSQENQLFSKTTEKEKEQSWHAALYLKVLIVCVCVSVRERPSFHFLEKNELSAKNSINFYYPFIRCQLLFWAFRTQQWLK